MKKLLLLLALPASVAAADITGEIRTNLESSSKGAPCTLSTEKSRVTVTTTEQLGSGVALSAGLHIQAASTVGTTVFLKADSSVGTARIGGEQGLDRIWGSGATVRYTDPGKGMFGAATRAITYTSPEWRGVAAGMSLNQTTLLRDGKEVTISGKMLGGRYNLDSLNIYGITHQSPLGNSSAVVAVYSSGDLRVAGDYVTRWDGHKSSVASVMYSGVYLENRRDLLDGRFSRETALGYKYEFSKRTSAIIEVTNKSSMLMALSMRF